MPALLVEGERVVVAGDLHIGIEAKFEESKISFPRATAKMAQELVSICKANRSKSLVLLGDVKDSIGHVTLAEKSLIREFFSALEGFEVRIARGNHDAYLDTMLAEMGFDVEVSKEVLLEDVALMHGNAMPSADAVKKGYIACGHGHIAASVNGTDSKAWLVAEVGEGMHRHYEEYNGAIRLVNAPAFNRLIIGSRVGYGTEEHIPMLNNELFDFAHANFYDLYGNRISDRHRP